LKLLHHQFFSFITDSILFHPTTTAAAAFAHKNGKIRICAKALQTFYESFCVSLHVYRLACENHAQDKRHNFE
jgi:hypothetical protein